MVGAVTGEEGDFYGAGRGGEACDGDGRGRRTPGLFTEATRQPNEEEGDGASGQLVVSLGECSKCEWDRTVTGLSVFSILRLSSLYRPDPPITPCEISQRPSAARSRRATERGTYR